MNEMSSIVTNQNKEMWKVMYFEILVLGNNFNTLIIYKLKLS